MSKKRVKIQSDILADAIIETIKERKGLDVVKIDLKEIETAVCRFFIICHGTSSTHVSSLADNVKKTISKTQKEKPWHTEGEYNKEWILMDYIDVVVHIFKKEKRDFYKLENLWADANIKYIEQSA